MERYYQLEEMLVVGFKTQDELEWYKKLKSDYESETQDYSFSIREITGQLELMIQTRENDFPRLNDALKQEYLGLTRQLEFFDLRLAQQYVRRLENG